MANLHNTKVLYLFSMHSMPAWDCLPAARHYNNE